MRLLGPSRICFSVLSLSLVVLLAGCLPPSADRNGPDNATSIDPALAFDNPAGDTTTFGAPAWGDPKFPNQPVEDFLTPLQPLDRGDSVAPADPSDEILPDLDLDPTCGVGELELEPLEIDLLLDDFADDDADPAEVEPSEAGAPDAAPEDDPVDKNIFEGLYPDVDLPDEVDGSAVDP